MTRLGGGRDDLGRSGAKQTGTRGGAFVGIKDAVIILQSLQAGNFYSWGDISKLNELIDVKRSLLGNSEEILGLDRESILGVSLRSLVHQPHVT